MMRYFKMKKIIFGIIFLTLMSSVFAAEMDLAALNKELAGNTIPKPLDKLFGDEKVNIHFELENGEELNVGLLTDNGKFKSLTAGELANPSLNVYTSEKVVKEIESAEDPGKALKNAFENKEITYKAVGLMNKIKFMFLSLVIQMAGGFNEEEAVEETKETVEEKVADPVTEEDAKETTNDNPTETDATESAEETDDAKEVEEPVEEVVETVEEPAGPETHLVKLIDGGFDVNTTLVINVGDTVEWKNVRTGTFKKALVLGSAQCVKIKSSIYQAGESYSWTFDKAETCTIVDGIYTTETMKVQVK
jgi:hypothetical protein